MELWRILLKRAYEVAAESPDPSTQNGALVVQAVGVALNLHAGKENPISSSDVLGQDCNRLPDGMHPTPELLSPPLKYLYIRHAEYGAIWSAMRHRLVCDFHSYTLVCPWAACTNCAKMIVDSGIRQLVRHKQAHLQSAENTKWKDEIFHADIMLRNAGVEIIDFDGKVGAPPILHGGKIWHP